MTTNIIYYIIKSVVNLVFIDIIILLIHQFIVYSCYFVNVYYQYYYLYYIYIYIYILYSVVAYINMYIEYDLITKFPLF